MIRKDYKLFKDTKMQLEKCKMVIDDFLKQPTETLRREELEDIFDEFDQFIEKDLLPVMCAWAGGCKITEYNKCLRNVKLVLKEKKRKMAKNPKIKIRLKTDVESLADVISDKVYQMNRIREEELAFQREKFSFEKKTKDRVDISLREYEQMKRDMEWLQSQNTKYASIFAKLKLDQYIDCIDPRTVVVITKKDLQSLNTKVHISFVCDKLIENPTERENGLFH